MGEKRTKKTGEAQDNGIMRFEPFNKRTMGVSKKGFKPLASISINSELGICFVKDLELNISHVKYSFHVV